MGKQADTVLKNMIIRVQTKRHNETNYIFDEEQLFLLLKESQRISKGALLRIFREI